MRNDDVVYTCSLLDKNELDCIIEQYGTIGLIILKEKNLPRNYNISTVGNNIMVLGKALSKIPSDMKTIIINNHFIDVYSLNKLLSNYDDKVVIILSYYNHPEALMDANDFIINYNILTVNYETPDFVYKNCATYQGKLYDIRAFFINTLYSWFNYKNIYSDYRMLRNENGFINNLIDILSFGYITDHSVLENKSGEIKDNNKVRLLNLVNSKQIQFNEQEKDQRNNEQASKIKKLYNEWYSVLACWNIILNDYSISINEDILKDLSKMNKVQKIGKALGIDAAIGAIMAGVSINDILPEAGISEIIKKDMSTLYQYYESFIDTIFQN